MTLTFLNEIQMKCMLTAFLCVFYSMHGHAQKEDFQWLFNASSIDNCMAHPLDSICGATVLDFNYDPPKYYRNREITLDMDHANASVCDDEGQLLLYSNQQAVHGPDHQAIINGDTINYGPKWPEFTWPNENGDWMPSGYRFTQGVGILPRPGRSDEYYIVYFNFDRLEDNLRSILYQEIKNESDGQYKIVTDEIELIDSLPSVFRATACRHGNGRDWWMVDFSRDTAFIYLVTETDIRLNNKQKLESNIRLGLGQLKFNSEGNKLALINGVDFSGLGVEFLFMDFDRCTGTITNQQFKRYSGTDVGLTSGVEFSASGRYVYRSTLENIFQYDTEADDFFASEIIVGEYDGSVEPIGFMLPSKFGLLQIGPDNKIYCSIPFQGVSMHVIHEPDRPGLECRLETKAFQIPTFVYGTTPTVHTYRLGPLDGSDCDTLGIDNYPQAWFRYEQDTLDYLQLRFVDLSYFRPETWSWDFGDGQTSTERFPEHRYDDKGSYEVCLTVSNENSSHTYCRILELGTTSTGELDKSYDISLFPGFCGLISVKYFNKEIVC